MDLVDTLKIVVPIIIALVAAVFAMTRWSIDRQSEAAAEMQKAMGENLNRNINQLGNNLEVFKQDMVSWRSGFEKRVLGVEQHIARFEKEVAGGYIKRQDWLDHSMSLERKIDQLRNDTHKELQVIIRELGKSNRNQ